MFTTDQIRLATWYGINVLDYRDAETLQAAIEQAAIVEYNITERDKICLSN